MIIQPSIALENNLFLIQNESTTICFMLLGKNFVSYVLTDETKTKIYSIRHYYTGNQVIGKSDFNAILNDSHLTKAKHYHIAVHTLKSTLIPNSLYLPEHKNTYLNTLVDIEPEETIQAQILPTGITSLFTLKQSTVQFLNTKLKNITYYDATASLLNSYPAHIIHEHQTSIFIAIHDESATITHYKKHQLILQQTIEYTTTQDVLYTIANLIHIQKIDPHTLGIQLHGEIDKVEQTANLLKTYYTYVRFSTRIKELQYPDTLYAKPAHYFFNLFSLITCAS